MPVKNTKYQKNPVKRPKLVSLLSQLDSIFPLKNTLTKNIKFLRIVKLSLFLHFAYC